MPAFEPAFARQRASASAKEALLFELGRARVAVSAAFQGLTPAAAERPVAPGKWSPKEIVIHLAIRDLARLDVFDAARAGTPVPWTGYDDAAMAAENEADLAPRRGLSWDEAVRLLHTAREQLLARTLEVPAEPAEIWSEAHAFGAMLRRLTPHDRKHAEQIRQARLAGRP